MATHSSILGWRIPWTEEPGGLQSMGSQSWTRLSNYHFHFHALFSLNILSPSSPALRFAAEWEPATS